MVIIAMSCFQETPAAGWLSTAGTINSRPAAGPAQPLASFFWSHMGWILVDSRSCRASEFTSVRQGILRDRFYVHSSAIMAGLDQSRRCHYFRRRIGLAWLAGERLIRRRRPDLAS